MLGRDDDADLDLDSHRLQRESRLAASELARAAQNCTRRRKEAQVVHNVQEAKQQHQRELTIESKLCARQTPRTYEQAMLDMYGPSPLDSPTAVAQRDLDATFLADSEKRHGMMYTTDGVSEPPAVLPDLQDRLQSACQKHAQLMELIQERKAEENAQMSMALRYPGWQHNNGQ